ncbi:MAG TPA: hypothetical protein VGE63_01760 [Candidatus Paceibacterota bacterium]
MQFTIAAILLIWSALVLPTWLLIPICIVVFFVTPFRGIILITLFLSVLMSGAELTTLAIVFGCIGVLIIAGERIKDSMKIPQVI